MNGLMGKAMAGLGKGMAMVGEMGHAAKLQGGLERMKAEILAQRDKTLAGYDDNRLDRKIASDERIANTGIQAQRDLKQEERGWQLQDAKAKRIADAEDKVAKQEFDLKKLDYEHKLKKEFEEFKVEHGTKDTSTLIQNVNFLVKAEIAGSPREAFDMLKTSMEKPEHEAILDLAGALRGGFGYSGKDGIDRSMQDATRMVRSLRGASAASKPDAVTPGAKSKSYTDEDLQFTARKHGITVDEVKRRLGIR